MGNGITPTIHILLMKEYLSEEVESVDEYILTNYNQNSISYVSDPVYDIKKENLKSTSLVSYNNILIFRLVMVQNH